MSFGVVRPPSSRTSSSATSLVMSKYAVLGNDSSSWNLKCLLELPPLKVPFPSHFSSAARGGHLSLKGVTSPSSRLKRANSAEELREIFDENGRELLPDESSLSKELLKGPGGAGASLPAAKL